MVSTCTPTPREAARAQRQAGAHRHLAGGGAAHARPRLLKAPLVSKFQPKEDGLAFNLKPYLWELFRAPYNLEESL